MKSPLSAMLFAAGLALGLSGAAAAQSGGETTSSQSPNGALVTSKLVDAFTEFAGSQENAQALVTGLRSGGEITLTGAGGTGAGGRDAAGKPATTTFTSPAGPMGYGEAYVALALAKDQLTGYGIENPTPSQIAASLNGGTVSTSQLGDMQLQGVLQMRADGMGWGRIAQAQGTKLGWVVSGMRSNGASHAGSIVPTSFGTSTGADTGPANGGRAAAGKGGASSDSTGITNATGGHAAASGNPGGAKGKGIVDAGSGAHGNAGSAHYGRGVHTAFGASAAAGGAAYAYGKSKSHGVVTVNGAGSGASAGATAGAGIVNAGGGSPGQPAAASAASHGQGAGVATAAGGGHGHRHGRGHAYGHGKHDR